MAKTTGRRSFVVQVMSTLAGAWVGVSTGGFAAWLVGCGTSKQPASAPHPATVGEPMAPGADPVPTPIATGDPSPVSIATGDPPPPDSPDAGVEPVGPRPPGPVVKYGGPPPDFVGPPPNTPRPMYGGPSMAPPAVPKYGGMMRPKYGGARKYGGPPNAPPDDGF